MNQLIAQAGVGEFGIAEFCISIIFSLISGFIIMLIYRMYFRKVLERNESLAKSFVFIAPSISAIFWAIQYSLPLSLGLLGALSFVRFRTPIKKSEDIGFILLVISVSLLSSVYRFYAAGILIAVILVATLAKSLLIDGALPILAPSKAVSLFVMTDTKEAGTIAQKITESLQSKYPGLKNRHISLDDIIPQEAGHHLRITVHFPKFSSTVLSEVHSLISQIDGITRTEAFSEKNLSE